MPSRHLVLASASPARLRLLRDAGFAPSAIVSGVDEDAVSAPSVDQLVQALAEAKAEVVAGRAEAADAVVVGCDSLFEVRGEVWGKVGTAAEATARVRALRGSKGTLHTGHCVIDARTGRRAASVRATHVSVGPMTDAQVDAYVASGEPVGVAGSFTLDGRAAVFVDHIDGDPSNVIGLSLPLFRELLAAVGVEVTDLWA